MSMLYQIHPPHYLLARRKYCILCQVYCILLSVTFSHYSDLSTVNVVQVSIVRRLYTLSLILDHHSPQQ